MSQRSGAHCRAWLLRTGQAPAHYSSRPEVGAPLPGDAWESVPHPAVPCNFLPPLLHNSLPLGALSLQGQMFSSYRTPFLRHSYQGRPRTPGRQEWLQIPTLPLPPSHLDKLLSLPECLRDPRSLCITFPIQCRGLQLYPSTSALGLELSPGHSVYFFLFYFFTTLPPSLSCPLSDPSLLSFEALLSTFLPLFGLFPSPGCLLPVGTRTLPTC